MTLEEYAKELRRELLNNGDWESVVKSIKEARHEDGSVLTKNEREEIIKYLKKNHRWVNGMRLLTESDNSAFLAMVRKIGDALREGK